MANKIITSITRKTRRSHLWFLLVFVLGITVSYIVCMQLDSYGKLSNDLENFSMMSRPVENVPVKGIILPHHLLVKAFMDKFYAEIAANNSYDRIVLLSPNHFDFGFNFLQTTDQVTVGSRHTMTELDRAAGVQLDQSWIRRLNNDKAAIIETSNFGQEHGVYAEYSFLKKYFPEATIVPIIVKNNTPCDKLDVLASELKLLDTESGGRTLFLASLDFTHYSEERVAIRNDRRTIQWLKNPPSAGEMCLSAKNAAVSLDTETPDAVAIDSAPVFYLINTLMDNFGTTNFRLWTRTSSAAMIKTLPGKDNTTHIFGYFF